MNYAPRVSMSYVELSTVLSLWAKSCESMVVYEHDADEEVATTHCHLLMIKSKYATPEPLKRQLYEVLSNEKRKGNDLWAWTHKDYPDPDLCYITYMSKGILEPVMTQNLSSSLIESYKKKWVDRKEEVRDTKKGSEFDQLLTSYEKYIKTTKIKPYITTIKSWIKSRYLSQRKAIPRGSDTNRYAYSIYAIVQKVDVDAADWQAQIEGIDIN